jgi:hypothetical protein
MGVRIVNDHTVKDLLAEQRDGGFDAVFVAIGAHLSKKVDLPSRDAEQGRRRGELPADRGERRPAGDGPAGRRVRRRQHRHGRRPRRAPAGRGPRR